jgi:hypothetical protein
VAKLLESIERVIAVWFRDARCDRTGEVAFRWTLQLTNHNRLYLVKEEAGRPPKRHRVWSGFDGPGYAPRFARALGFGPRTRPGANRKRYLKRYPEATHLTFHLTEDQRRRLRRHGYLIL